MNTNTIQENFNEKQMLTTLKEALASSRKTLMEDGILLICWGIVFSLGFAWNFYNAVVLVPSRIRDLMLILKPTIGVLLIAFTILGGQMATASPPTGKGNPIRAIW